MKTQFSILLIAAALPNLASGSAIFSNLGPGQSYDITQGNPIGNDFLGDLAAQGDTFTPTATAALAFVDLALSCVANCGSPQSFDVELRGDSSDAPGAVIESFSFAGVSLGGLGNNNPLVTATSILRPTLESGSRYWLTVSASNNFFIAWNQNLTGDPSDQAVSSDGGITWFSPSGMTPSAYEVEGTVLTPEPSTLILFCGATWFGFCGYRRTQACAAIAAPRLVRLSPHPGLCGYRHARSVHAATSPHVLRQWRNSSPAARLAPNLYELLNDSGIRRWRAILKGQAAMQVSVLPRQLVVVKLAYAVPEFLKLLQVHRLFTPLPSTSSHGRIQILHQIDASAVLHDESSVSCSAFIRPPCPTTMPDNDARTIYVT